MLAVSGWFRSLTIEFCALLTEKSCSSYKKYYSVSKSSVSARLVVMVWPYQYWRRFKTKYQHQNTVTWVLRHNSSSSSSRHSRFPSQRRPHLFLSEHSIIPLLWQWSAVNPEDYERQKVKELEVFQISYLII